jgi:hypothetical protein
LRLRERVNLFGRPSLRHHIPTHRWPAQLNCHAALAWLGSPHPSALASTIK